ncbi:MAG: hypothetical protein ACRDJI_07325 [Actinomycetota bacterium]
MKRWLVLGIVVALWAPLAVWAAQENRVGRVDRQGFSSSTTPTSTSDTEWTNVDYLDGVPAYCPRKGGATATVSLQLASGSGPVEVRVTMVDAFFSGDKGVLMAPGIITFDTGTGTTGSSSYSFTFVTGWIPGEHGSEFVVQWRVPSATQTATAEKASLAVTWNDKKGPCL